MKKMSKSLALVMALVMLLALCACGGSGTRSANGPDFETRIREAETKMKNLESQHMDMDMDVVMEMSVMGQSEKVDMRVYYSMDITKNPARGKLVMTASTMGQTQEMTLYTDENGMAYICTDGRNWQRQASQNSEIENLDADQMMQLFIKNSSSFRETGTETINGARCTVYSGELSGEYVEEVMKMTGMDSTLGSSLGLGNMDGVFKDLGNIPMTVAIDNENGYLVRYTMDMSGVMEKLMKNVFDTILQSQGMSGVSIEIKVPKCDCTATLSQFNSVPEIVIPAEAKG